MSKRPCKQCGTNRCTHKRAGRARAKHFTREYQQAARAQVRRESLQRAGALGFAALAAKRGLQYATECVSRWRRAHPSSIESTVMGWLTELGEPFQHDHLFLHYLLYPDFQLAARRLVIEVDGAYWHRQRGAHDAAKEAIYQREGYRVLRLAEPCVHDGSAKQQLVEVLREVGR